MYGKILKFIQYNSLKRNMGIVIYCIAVTLYKVVAEGICVVIIMFAHKEAIVSLIFGICEGNLHGGFVNGLHLNVVGYLSGSFFADIALCFGNVSGCEIRNLHALGIEHGLRV